MNQIAEFSTYNIMRNSTIVYPVKYGSEIDIFVLKMMIKSGLEIFFLKFFHALTIAERLT